MSAWYISSGCEFPLCLLVVHKNEKPVISSASYNLVPKVSHCHCAHPREMGMKETDECVYFFSLASTDSNVWRYHDQVSNLLQCDFSRLASSAPSSITLTAAATDLTVVGLDKIKSVTVVQSIQTTYAKGQQIYTEDCPQVLLLSGAHPTTRHGLALLTPC